MFGRGRFIAAQDHETFTVLCVCVCILLVYAGFWKENRGGEKCARFRDDAYKKGEWRSVREG